MGLQKEPRNQRSQCTDDPGPQSGPKGRLKAGYSHWVRQNRQSKLAGSLGSRSQRSRRRVRGQSSGPGVIPGPPLRYLLRPGGRGGPSATGPSEAPPPCSHSGAPTCRLHAGPPRHRNAPAPPAPAGSCSSVAYGGREETKSREITRGTTTPRKQRALEAGHEPVVPADWLFVVQEGQDRAVAWATL